jgi:hypothetical protein
MKVLKVEHCDDIYLDAYKQTLTQFANKITLDLLFNYNDSNKILCQLSRSITSAVNPKIYLHHHLTIYSLEFIPGKEEVILGVLNFTCHDKQNMDAYIVNLMTDHHRVWKYTTLHYDYPEQQLNNQVLTLLRLCKIDKEAYLANPAILSKTFTK